MTTEQAKSAVIRHLTVEDTVHKVRGVAVRVGYANYLNDNLPFYELTFIDKKAYATYNARVEECEIVYETQSTDDGDF